MQPQPQNKLTEIAVFAIVAMLVISAVLLLYFGKIDFTGMLTMFGFAGGVLGVQGAFKAPSPVQSAQLQGLFSQVMAVLPGLFSQLQPPAVTIHNTIPVPVQAASASAPPVPGVASNSATPAPQPQSQFAPLPMPSWTASALPTVTPPQQGQ